jgi:N-acetyl-anhydromuramyl-L-alanine amidase AmpD
MRLRNNPLPTGQFIPFDSANPGPEYIQIVPHYTAGFSADSSIAGWKADPDRVGTPYIIERDGTVVQTLDPDKGWLWHLGGNNSIVVPNNKIKGNPIITTQASTINRRSLGIELANIGHLTLKRDTLYSYVGPFCKLTETEKYWKAPQLWRGFQYWERFTTPQLSALKELVKSLSIRYRIPMSILAPHLRNAVCPYEAHQFHGIVCHHNYLGKLDAGIQLNLEWLIS